MVEPGQYYLVPLRRGGASMSEVVFAESVLAAKLIAEVRRPGFTADGPVRAGVGPCGTGSCSPTADDGR